MILFANPREQYLSHKRVINKAIKRVLDSGYYVGGNELKEFEKEFAEYIGTKYSVGVGNCTDGLQLALMALEIKDGDEIITVSHTVSCTVSAIVSAGATPVLVDVDPNSYNIDPDEIRKAITSKTRAILPVHLYGQPANMDEIMQIALAYDLKVVEDCAQATGAEYKGKKVGNFGHVSCFSFYPTKNLGCVGDGGIVLTNNPVLFRRIRCLSEVGWIKKYVSAYNGINSRLDEIQAAILRVKLKYIDSDNDKRIKIADRYFKELKDCSFILPKISNDVKHVYHQYVIQCSDRKKLLMYLSQNDIIAGVHYPISIHRQPIYKKLRRGNMSITQRLTNTVVSLPIYPELDKNKIIKTIRILQEFK